MNSEKKKELAVKIADLLIENEAFMDVAIYYDDNRMTYGDGYKGINIIKKNVADIIEYNNPETLTMGFEGPFYHAMNYGDNPKLIKKFDQLLTTFGLYYELGFAWSLTLYKL